MKCSVSLLRALVALMVMSPAVAMSQVFTWPAVLGVTKKPTGAPNNYEFDAFAFLGASMVAPDGTVFTQSTPTLVGLSATDLTTRFAGQWTINDTEDLPPGVIEQHRFNLSAAALVNDFAPNPQMITPADGAVLPPVFEVRWQDGDPNGSGFQTRGLSPFDFTRLGDDHYRLSVKFAPGEDQKVGVFSAASNRNTFLPLATPVTPNPIRRFDPYVQRSSISLPRSFTVIVPEPASGVLAALAAALIGRRNRRVVRHPR
jgi:hypothetical protein